MTLEEIGQRLDLTTINTRITKSLENWVEITTGYGILDRLKLIAMLLLVFVSIPTITTVTFVVMLFLFLVSIYTETLTAIPLGIWWLLTGKSYHGWLYKRFLTVISGIKHH
jgi:hypothetical protein